MDSTIVLAILLTITLIILLIVTWRYVSVRDYLDKRIGDHERKLLTHLEQSKPVTKDELSDVFSDTVRLRDIYQVVSALGQVVTAQERIATQLSSIEEEIAKLKLVSTEQSKPTNAVSKGKFGEAIVEQQLKILPPKWIEQQVLFSDGRIVEFALRTPDHRLIPIDSKWAAMDLLTQYEETQDELVKRQLLQRIRGTVLARAKEVSKYLHEQRTLGFCIAAVPDPVFEMCLRLQSHLTLHNVALVSYSMLVPYLLIIIDFLNSTEQAGRVLQASHGIHHTLTYLEQVQEVIDRRVSQTFDTVKRQQVQHLSYNSQLDTITGRLQAVQATINEINSAVPGRVDPLNVRELASTPRELQHHLDIIRRQILNLGGPSSKADQDTQ